MNKNQKKHQLQKQLGFAESDKVPLVIVPVVDEAISRILTEIIAGIAALGLQMVLVRPDDESLQSTCRTWTEQFPENIQIIDSEENEGTAFDIAVVHELTEDQLDLIKDFRQVPIAAKGKIEPFDPIEEKGSGFIYDEGNSWTLFAALVRASETFRFPYDWMNLVKAVQRII